MKSTSFKKFNNFTSFSLKCRKELSQVARSSGNDFYLYSHILFPLSYHIIDNKKELALWEWKPSGKPHS